MTLIKSKRLKPFEWREHQNPIYPEHRYTNLLSYPNQFKSLDDALYEYNQIGAFNNVQFKLLSKRIEKGETLPTSFTLACAVHGNAGIRTHKNVKQGLNLKAEKEQPCPVHVKFRYVRHQQQYRRSTQMCMHHSHDLELTKIQLTGDKVAKEVLEFVQAKIPAPLIHKVLQQKFSSLVKFTQVLRLI